MTVALRELRVVAVGPAQRSLGRSLSSLSVALLAAFATLRTLVSFEVLQLGGLLGCAAHRVWLRELLSYLLLDDGVGMWPFGGEVFLVSVW